MNTDVVNTAKATIALTVEEKISVRQDKDSKLIWEKKPKPRRFTAAELWNIRRNARTFRVY